MKNPQRILLLSFISLLTLPLSASAFYFGANEGMVTKDPIEGDAYLAGKSIYIEEEIQGDAYLAAESVVVNQGIGQDGMLAGQNLQVNAEVKDDLRMMGENIELNGKVGGDLMMAGSKIKMKPGATVEESVLFAGDNVTLEGLVKGDLIGVSSHLYLNAVIGGDVKLNYAEEIIVGPEAKIEGNLTYTAATKKSDLEKIAKGKVKYESAESKDFLSKKTASGVALSVLIFSFLSALLIGLLFMAGFRYLPYQLTELVGKNPLKSLGLGGLLVFVFPVLIGALMATIAGIPLAIILFIAWLILIYVSKILVSVVIAGKCFHLKEGADFGRRFLTFALVLAIYDGLTLVPILGIMKGNGALVALGSLIGVVKMLATLVALGGLMLYKFELFKAMRKKKLI